MISTNGGRQCIKLNANGTPVTCPSYEAQLFEYSKAMNIVKSLPKTLHKFHFRVVPVPEQISTNTTGEANAEVQQAEMPYIENKEYQIPDSVKELLGKIEDYNELLRYLNKRKPSLYNELSNVDCELSNRLHDIELTSSKNACDGYKEYKKIKEVLHKRREIKDELIVVNAILEENLKSVNSTRIQKVVDGLSKRKFTIRDVDLDSIYGD